MNTQHDTPNIPFDPAIEEAVLGAILTNPAGYHAVATILTRADDFWLVRHQWIYEAIRRCAVTHERFDYLMVAGELDKAGHLEDIGGSPYLLRLVNNTPDSTLGEQYAEYIRTRAVRRRMLEAADSIKAAALDDELTLEQATKAIEQTIFEAIANGTKTRTRHLRDIAREYYDQVIAIQRGDADTIGIPTGIYDLDTLTKGAQRGRLTYVAGRPGMGKSAFMVNAALHAARHNQRVFVWSGEMSVYENFARLVSIETAVDTQRQQTGNMSPDEISRFTEASLKRLPDIPIWIDDTPGISIATLRSMCMRHAALYGVDLVIADYTGLLKAAGKTRGRVEEIGEISRGLKALAMELNVPVYAGAQLNRRCEDRQNKRPILSDLRDSGDLEQDGDVIMFLYRDEVYNPASEHRGLAELIIAKQRNGPTGTAFARFEPHIMRFSNAQLETVNLNGRYPHDT